MVDHWWRGDDAPADRAFTTNGVMALQAMPDGRLHAGLWAGGLMEVAADGAVVSRSRPLPHEGTSLAGLNVRALLLARNGTLWIGHENGLSLLDPLRNRSAWIGPVAEGQPGVDASGVSAILRDGDMLFVGTGRGGVNRVDLGTGAVTAVQHDPRRRDSLPDDAIWDMADTGDGRLMLATSGGLARLSKDNLRAETLATSPVLPSDDVVTVARARDGGYWLATWAGGVVRVDAAGGVARTWRAADGLDTETMVAVYEDARGRVLASNADGLFLLGRDGRFDLGHLGDQPLRDGAHLLGDLRIGIDRLLLLQDFLVGLQAERLLLFHADRIVDQHLLAGIRIDDAVVQVIAPAVHQEAQQDQPAQVAQSAAATPASLPVLRATVRILPHHPLPGG